MSFIGTAISAAKLAVKAKAPTLMVVGGIGLMGGAAVLGARQTLNVEEIMGDHLPDLEKIQEGESLELEGYTTELVRADRIMVYTRLLLDLGKNYALPIGMFVGGVALVAAGHNVLVKRNAVLAVAFTGLQTAFQNYRSRVVNEFGHEADQAMLSGYRSTEVVDEDGKVAVIRERDWEKADEDMYNRVFEQGESTEWTRDSSINRHFIATQQKMAQDRLGWSGVLYLSDVYKALGFGETPVSRVVGWKVTRNPDGTKEYPTVDFGLDKVDNPLSWEENREGAIYLDFNCQGLIVGGEVQKILEGSR